MRPTLVLSLDMELIWGSFDHMSPARFNARYPDLRQVNRDLLHLLEEHGVSATWAVVGHLFLSSCRRDASGRAHPELTRPRYAWYPKDWFASDPCSSRHRDPLFYGDDLVDMLLGARVAQEVGCHSFSHLIFGDPGCSAAAAEDDLAACVAGARSRGVTLRSFVFPRNLEGHHQLLRKYGFIAYRGQEPVWYRQLPPRVRRGAHLAEQALCLPPPVSLPTESLPGLWNIPGSLLFLHRGGVRRFIPLAARLARARAGLRRAVREGKIFHLWFHPFNLCCDRAGMFATLRSILAEAVALREQGLLAIHTLGEVGASLSTA